MLGQRPSPMLKACWRTCPVAFHSTACRQGKVNAKCSSHVSRSFGSTRRARRSQLAERSCTHLKALPDSSDQTGDAIAARARVRSEVLAPFRLVRLVLYGFFVISASVGLVIALAQLPGGLADAPGALPTQGTLEGIGIDIGAIVVLSLLFRSDWKARQKQIARLTREERLAVLQIELSNRKTVRLGQLRKFARPILVAGTSLQVSKAVEAAEAMRDELVERAILLIPLPLFDQDGTAAEAMSLTEEDLKFKATPLRQDAWRKWFEEQMQLANASPEKGLYVGLRLDGRVRASGTGSPPFQRFVKELAPVTGAWKGILDGMDGKVDAWN